MEEQAIPNRDTFLPDVLVLGPGGIKGFLELGALSALEQQNILSRVNTYAGVSVGALLCLLLVCGYKVTEIINDALETNLFSDFSMDFIKMKKNTGLVSNQVVKNKLIQRVTDKFGIVPTMAQLYQFTGLTFMTVTVNITKFQVEYMTHITEPNITCVDAALLSINIPVIFHMIRWNGCIYVDGALANPYPVDQFDDGTRNILGISISIREDTSETMDDSTYLHRCIDMPMTEMKRRIMRSCSPRCKHLELSTDVIDSVGFNTDLSGKSKMVLSGYQRAKHFLKRLRVTSSNMTTLS